MVQLERPRLAAAVTPTIHVGAPFAIASPNGAPNGAGDVPRRRGTGRPLPRWRGN